MVKQDSANRLTLDDLSTLLPKPVSALVELPSLGNFYDPSLLNEGKVEVFPITAREEKLIAGMQGGMEDLMDLLLPRCMKTSIPPGELLVTDKFYLLIALRANSYGEEYSVQLTCPSCETTGKYSLMLLTDLEVKKSKPTDAEPFYAALPESKLRIGFRLTRGKDVRAVKNYVDGQASKGIASEGDSGYIFRLARQIVSVNGKGLDMLTALELVSRLVAKDCAVLKNAYEKATPGITTSFTKKCTSCGKKIASELPLTAEFFRPNYGTEEGTDGETTLLD
jgi:hypothetical protein